LAVNKWFQHKPELMGPVGVKFKTPKEKKNEKKKKSGRRTNRVWKDYFSMIRNRDNCLGGNFR